MAISNNKEIYYHNMSNEGFWRLLYEIANITEEELYQRIRANGDELYISDSDKQIKTIISLKKSDQINFDNYYFHYFTDKIGMTMEEKEALWDSGYHLPNILTAEYKDGVLAWKET